MAFDREDVGSGVSNDASDLGKTAQTGAGIVKGTKDAAHNVKAATNRLIKGTKKPKTSPIAGIIWKCKLIVRAVIILIVISCIFNLEYSSSVINEVSHANQSEIVASLKEAEIGESQGYDFRYENMSFENDKALLQRTFQDAQDKTTQVLNLAINDTTRQIDNKIQAEKQKWELEHPGESLIIDKTGIQHAENNPVTDEEALFVSAAYSVSVKNTMSEEIDEYYKTQEVSQLGDLKKKLNTLVSLAPDPEAVHTEGYDVFGNYFITADIKIYFKDVAVTTKNADGSTTTIILHYLIAEGSYNPVIYQRVAEKAFGYEPDEPYDIEVPTYTNTDYIYELAMNTAELLELESGLGNDLGLHMYDAYYAGEANGDVVALAMRYQGISNGSPYWSTFGYSYRVPWCAMFVSWIADQLGYIDAGIIPKFASCRVGMAWFQNHNQYQSAKSGYIPKAGDIVFFDWKQNGVRDGLPNHVGYVRYADSNYVYTIEGNTSGENGGSGVFAKKRLYADILGYGIPLYNTKS